MQHLERLNDWNRFGTSIFSKMTALANQVGAINLAQGFPDFDGPDQIKHRALEAIAKGPNQYATSIGLRNLRQGIAKRRYRTTAMNYDPETEITVTSGATEGIYCALQALLQPGDEIICFEPSYDCYEPAAHARGAKTRYVRLQPPRFEFGMAQLEAQITSKTRLIVLNTPQNPSGKVFSRIELEIIAAAAIKHDLVVVADEVYDEIVFDSNQHLSIATFPGMRDRTVVVASTAKTYSFTGWKVGYTLASVPISTAIRNIHQYTVFCSAAPLQDAMFEAFELPDSYYDELRHMMLTARDRLLGALLRNGWKAEKPQGTYFICADFSEHSDVPDQRMALLLAEKAGIATIPMSSFYPGNSADAAPRTWLRFAFCKVPKTIDRAIEKIDAIKWKSI
jgi:aspartate/methionine/tyrosine aminotransferase